MEWGIVVFLLWRRKKETKLYRGCEETHSVDIFLQYPRMNVSFLDQCKCWLFLIVYMSSSNMAICEALHCDHNYYIIN